LRKGQAVKVPGSQYEFRVADFIPAGRLVEQYEPGEGRDAVRVIEVSARAPAGEVRDLWLAMGKARAIHIGGETLTLWFGPRLRQPAAAQPRPAP